MVNMNNDQFLLMITIALAIIYALLWLFTYKP